MSFKEYLKETDKNKAIKLVCGLIEKNPEPAEKEMLELDVVALRGLVALLQHESSDSSSSAQQLNYLAQIERDKTQVANLRQLFTLMVNVSDFQKPLTLLFKAGITAQLKRTFEYIIGKIDSQVTIPFGHLECPWSRLAKHCVYVVAMLCVDNTQQAALGDAFIDKLLATVNECKYGVNTRRQAAECLIVLIKGFEENKKKCKNGDRIDKIPTLADSIKNAGDYALQANIVEFIHRIDIPRKQHSKLFESFATDSLTKAQLAKAFAQVGSKSTDEYLAQIRVFVNLLNESLPAEERTVHSFLSADTGIYVGIYNIPQTYIDFGSEGITFYCKPPGQTETMLIDIKYHKIRTMRLAFSTSELVMQLSEPLEFFQPVYNPDQDDAFIGFKFNQDVLKLVKQYAAPIVSEVRRIVLGGNTQEEDQQQHSQVLDEVQPPAPTTPASSKRSAPAPAAVSPKQQQSTSPHMKPKMSTTVINIRSYEHVGDAPGEDPSIFLQQEQATPPNLQSRVASQTVKAGKGAPAVVVNIPSQDASPAASVASIQSTQYPVRAESPVTPTTAPPILTITTGKKAPPMNSKAASILDELDGEYALAEEQDDAMEDDEEEGGRKQKKSSKTKKTERKSSGSNAQQKKLETPPSSTKKRRGRPPKKAKQDEEHDEETEEKPVAAPARSRRSAPATTRATSTAATANDKGKKSRKSSPPQIQVHQDSDDEMPDALEPPTAPNNTSLLSMPIPIVVEDNDESFLTLDQIKKKRSAKGINDTLNTTGDFGSPASAATPDGDSDSEDDGKKSKARGKLMPRTMFNETLSIANTSFLQFDESKLAAPGPAKTKKKKSTSGKKRRYEDIDSQNDGTDAESMASILQVMRQLQMQRQATKQRREERVKASVQKDLNTLFSKKHEDIQQGRDRIVQWYTERIGQVQQRITAVSNKFKSVYEKFQKEVNELIKMHSDTLAELSTIEEQYKDKIAGFKKTEALVIQQLEKEADALLDDMEEQLASLNSKNDMQSTFATLFTGMGGAEDMAAVLGASSKRDAFGASSRKKARLEESSSSEDSE